MDTKIEWFNNLPNKNKNDIICMLYDICIGVSNHSVGIQKNIENFQFIKDALKEIVTETKAVDESIYSIIKKKFPRCNLIDNTSQETHGDYILTTNNVRFLIECKSRNERMLKTDPNSLLGDFNNECINTINRGEADVAIFIAKKSTYIPRFGTFEADGVDTIKGKRYIIYIADVLNYPERLVAAVELGIHLYFNNTDNTPSTMSNFIDVNNKVNSLSTHVHQLITLSENQKTVIESMTKLLKISRNELNAKVMDVNVCKDVVDITTDIMKQTNTKNVCIKTLEKELHKQNIPARRIRDSGGIKYINHIAKNNL